MKLEIDGSKVLYVFSAILGLVTIGYFSSNAIMSLTPVTKSFLILLVSASAVLTGKKFEKPQGPLLFFIGGSSYLVFLFYVVGKFDPGSGVVLGILAASSVLSAYIARNIRENRDFIQKERLRYVLGVFLVLGLALASVDYAAEQPSKNLSLEKEVYTSEGEKKKIGTLNVQNSFVLPQNLERTRLDSELCNSSRDVYLDVENEPDMIPGAKDLELNVTAGFHPERAEEGEEEPPSRVPISRGEECSGKKELLVSIDRDEYLD